jgi:hypothetical protein
MHNIQSPRTDDSAIEQQILAKGLTAPRVTPADLEANITHIVYFTGSEGALGATGAGVAVGYDFKADPLAHLDLLTFCVLVLKNGFTVTGESACASPENFDAEIGRNIALANAKQKIWPLMGYALKDELHKQTE